MSSTGPVPSESSPPPATDGKGPAWIRDIRVHKLWDLIDIGTFVWVGSEIARVAVPRYRVAIVAGFYSVALVGFLLIAFAGQQKNIKTYVRLEIAYDFLQGFVVAIFELKLGFFPKDVEIPVWAKIASIGTSFVDMFVLKGPAT